MERKSSNIFRRSLKYAVNFDKMLLVAVNIVPKRQN